MDTRGTGEVFDVNTRKGPFHGEGADVLAESLESLSTLGLALGGNTEKVLDKLGAGLLLELTRDFDDTVQEGCDDLDVFLAHVTGGDGGGTDSDTAGHLSRFCGKSAYTFSDKRERHTIARDSIL